MRKYNHHYYNLHLKEYSRVLRTETVSRAEKYLWKAILSRKQTGERFLRQRPIFHYIVDFFAPEIGLIIEIDGNNHLDKGDYDRNREEVLKKLGYELIRFSEGEVLNNIHEVSQQIIHSIECRKQMAEYSTSQ